MSASVIDVHIKNLRKLGYNSLLEWLEAGQGNHIYIGRKMPWVDGADTSKWHNPYSVKKYGREACLQLFRTYLENSDLITELEELRGKTLGCWCSENQDCHGKILIEYLDE